MKLKKIIFSLAFLAAPIWVAAQSSALPILQMNSDARSVAMGGNYYGQSRGNYLYTNPTSLLYNNQKFQVSLSGMMRPDLDKFYYGQFNAAYRLGGHGLYAGFRYWGGPEFKSEFASSKKAILPNEWSVDAGYAFKINNHFSASVSGSFLQSTIKSSATTFAFNASAFYRNDFGMGSYVVGISGGNFGPELDFGKKAGSFPLPAYAGGGGECQFLFGSEHRVNTSLSARYFFFPTDSQMLLADAGAEYTYKDILSARIGYGFGSKENSHIAMGIGTSFAGVTLDASYQMGLGNNPVKAALLTLGFGL